MRGDIPCTIAFLFVSIVLRMKSTVLILQVSSASVTVSRAGRVRKRGLFHDELLANSRANQKVSLD